MRAQSPIPRFRIGQTEIDVAAALKESGLAALVALGLSVIIVGIRIVDVKGGLSFDTRFMWVGIAVAGVFAGRFVLAARRQITRPKASERREDIADNIGAGVQLFSKYAAPVLIAFAIALPFMPFANRYNVDVATLVMTYIMLGWGLNIVV